MEARPEQTTMNVLYCLYPKHKAHERNQITPRILDINAISPNTNDL